MRVSFSQARPISSMNRTADKPVRMSQNADTVRFSADEDEMETHYPSFPTPRAKTWQAPAPLETFQPWVAAVAKKARQTFPSATDLKADWLIEHRYYKEAEALLAPLASTEPSLPTASAHLKLGQMYLKLYKDDKRWYGQRAGDRHTREGLAQLEILLTQPGAMVQDSAIFNCYRTAIAQASDVLGGSSLPLRKIELDEMIDGTDTLQRADQYYELALTYTLQKRFEAAEAASEKAVHIYQQFAVPHAVSYARLRLAEIKVEMSKFDEAEAILVDLRQNPTKHPASDPQEPPKVNEDVLHLLRRLYQKTGQAEKLQALYQTWDNKRH